MYARIIITESIRDFLVNGKIWTVKRRRETLMSVVTEYVEVSVDHSAQKRDGPFRDS